MQKIENLRELPEPLRRQIMWLLVGVFVIVIGVLWALTLSWQFASSSSAGNSTNATDSNLPSIGQSLQNDGGQIGSGIKGVLRNFILGSGDDNGSSNNGSPSNSGN